MSKTIVVVTDNLKDQINGVATTFNNIAQYAIEDGYDIKFIEPSMFKYFDCPGYPQVKLSIPFGIGKIISDINPDYIHIATEGPLGLAARLWCNKNKLKYNTSYHTKFPEFIKEMYRIPECITYAYVRWFHKDSEKVLTTTQTMVNELIENGFKQIVVPWTRGVDRNIFKSEYRQEHSEPVLLSVGRISKEKNLDVFCSLPLPYKKIVVGDGPYLEDLIQKYPDVEFVGKKIGVELAEYYANADVFVFTSKVDTFGIVIIESLSVGTPVAAYQVPGPIDILEQGITGYMGNDLVESIEKCLSLDRTIVEYHSHKWSWQNCWKVFQSHLILSK